MRLPCFILLASLLGGCAIQAPLPPQPLTYGCDEGREFSVSVAPAGDTATIVINHMRFGLRAEPATGSEEKFGCDVLTFWREGETARVDMEGSPQFSNCRVRR